jgi:hypothetical protein
MIPSPRSLVAAIAVTFIVGSGCGGGEPSPAAPAPYAVEGNVLKGMVGGATIKVFALAASGARGAQLGTATTTGAGTFEANLTPRPTAPFLAEASAGAYVDEATGATVTLSATDVMTAVVPAGTTWISITPLTHLAAGRALALAAAGTPLPTAVAASNAQVAQGFGVSDIVAIHAVAATDATALATASLDQRVLALVVAGLAQEAAALGVRAIDLVAALAVDQADGLLDGLDGSTPIGVPLIAGGTVALPATAATTSLQAAIDAFAASASNETNLTTAVVSPIATTVGPVGAGAFYATSTSLPAWKSGQTGSFQLTATGGTAPYTCTLTSGSLPGWLSLSTNCTLSGTAPVLAAGTTRTVSAPFTVTVSDSAASAVSQAVTLSVTVVQAAPTLTLVSPMPQGTVGVPYQQSPVVSVSGGSPPYHYGTGSFANGAPPPGLVVDLSGRVSGTPAAAGSYGFAVCAVDLVGSMTCSATSVAIVALPPGGLALTYSGTFSGAGDFQRPFPAWGTTCSFHNVFSGTVTVTLVVSAGGGYTGTSHVAGNWDSTATGGSTAEFTCLDTFGITWENDLGLSGTFPAVAWEDVWYTPGGSMVTGSFTGAASLTSLDGTQVMTLDTSTGSASLVMSLARP